MCDFNMVINYRVCSMGRLQGHQGYLFDVVVIVCAKRLYAERSTGCRKGDTTNHMLVTGQTYVSGNNQNQYLCIRAYLFDGRHRMHKAAGW